MHPHFTNKEGWRNLLVLKTLSQLLMGWRRSEGLCPPLSVPSPGSSGVLRAPGILSLKPNRALSLCLPDGSATQLDMIPPCGTRHEQAGAVHAELAAAVPLFGSVVSCGICHPVPTGSSGSDTGWLSDVGSWEYPSSGNNNGHPSNPPSTASDSWLRHAAHLVILSAG